jgi:DNA-binding response OmpR family regulator
MDHDTAGARASPAVLIVENDVLKRLATAADFRSQGFEVFEAADIAEAKTILKSVVVDVLFSNVSLIDGGQLARWVKQQRLPMRVFWVADEPPLRKPLHS